MNALIKAGTACPVPQVKIVALCITGGIVCLASIAALSDRDLNFDFTNSGVHFSMTKA